MNEEREKIQNELIIMIEKLDKQTKQRQNIEQQLKELNRAKKIINIRISMIKHMLFIKFMLNGLKVDSKDSFYEKYKLELIRLQKECKEMIIDTECKLNENFLESFISLTNRTEKLEEIVNEQENRKK